MSHATGRHMQRPSCVVARLAHTRVSPERYIKFTGSASAPPTHETEDQIIIGVHDVHTWHVASFMH